MQDSVPTPIRFFPLHQVRLRAGIFAERLEIHIRHMTEIEPDRLLAPFYEQAGLPVKSPRYGGWESRDISGHSLGHYLSALAHLHAANGDAEARTRVFHIVNELARCQEVNGDGYVLPVSKKAFDSISRGEIHATPFALNGVWVPFYTLHKVMAGLRDAYRLCDNDQALHISKRIGNWIEQLFSGLDPIQIQALLATEHGGMNEVLADLTFDSGDGKYLEIASRCFHHQHVLAPIFRGEDQLNGLHGNTQIPKIVGLAREFELNADPASELAAKSFWNHVVNQRSYANGGHGESEHFFPHEQFPKRLTPNTCETCNSYNMLKLTKHLFTWQPDAAQMDFVERVMINHIAANIGREPGEFGYFLGLGSAGVKVFSKPMDAWWCCVGTGMENPTRYSEQIYAYQGNELWVNLFMSSVLAWPEMGIEFIQDTLFPEDDVVHFRLRCEKDVTIRLHLRHPSWCDQPLLWLNGQAFEMQSKPSSYITITRIWRDGDSMEMRMPMKLRFDPLPHSEGKILAACYGPNVLAAIIPDQPDIFNPSRERYSEHLEARAKTDAFPPHFVADNFAELIAGLKPTTDFAYFHSDGTVMPADLTFVPLYQIYEEQYSVYLPCLNKSEWQKRESSIRSERNARLQIEAATLDHLTPGYQQPEIEHSLQSEQSAIEEFADRKCRTASNGGWFSYRMKIDPNKPVALVVTYWGGVWHERNFAIFIDDVLLARQQLLTNRPGDFFDQYYEIPFHRSKHLTHATVRFQSHPKDIAGGVYEIRIMRASAIPEDRYQQTIVFKDH